jgi:hypothetical protein
LFSVFIFYALERGFEIVITETKLLLNLLHKFLPIGQAYWHKIERRHIKTFQNLGQNKSNTETLNSVTSEKKL